MADEEVAHCSISIDDPLAANECIGRKAEPDTCKHAEIILFKTHD